MLITTMAGVIAAAIYLPEEGGYELIPNENAFGIGSP
jgi:hypothetical protein